MRIADVIQWEPASDGDLVWKHPISDIRFISQLIVHQSQQALLVRDGRALGTYGPGRHTLTTQNIFGWDAILRFIFNGETPVPAEVWCNYSGIENAVVMRVYDETES